MTDSTAGAACCCLNRWVCRHGNGKTRDQMSMPCGFEMARTVEGCPKALRMQGEIVTPQAHPEPQACAI